MEFDIEFEISAETNKGKVLTKIINKCFNLPYYKEDMHPDGLGYWQYFPYEGAEEDAINNYIENVDIKEIEDYFLEELEEDEKILKVR